MSKVICIAGESGSGKTTSMRNLDPETTMYIDCDKKGLSWKGWRSQYNGDKKNYLKTDFPQVALQALKKIDKEEQYKHIRVVVVDTINGLMIADEMRRCKEKGYDKWQDLAQSIYDLIDYVYVNHKASVGDSGLNSAEVYKIRIPEETENAEQYLKPEEYQKSSNPAGYWTIQVDDQIVLGECDLEIEKPADLRNVYQRHCKVLSWSDNRFGGLPHWRIEGV